MERIERKPEPEEVLRRAFAAMQARIWTAMPGIIQNVNRAAMTVDVQPTIEGIKTNPDGSTTAIQMPICPDCPLVLFGGGGAFLEFPIIPGDECLLVFASRSVDNWWGVGGVQPQSEPGRMHNLSDAFAIPGIRSQPRVKTLDASVVRLRTDANTAYVELNPSSGAVHIVAPGGINLNGMTIDSTGNVGNVGNVTSTGTVSAATAVKVGGVTLTVP